MRIRNTVSIIKRHSETTLLNCRDAGKREAGWWGRKSVSENCLGRGTVEDKRNSGIRAQARSARPGSLCANIVDSDLCHRFWKITSENNKISVNLSLDHNFSSVVAVTQHATLPRKENNVRVQCRRRLQLRQKYNWTKLNTVGQQKFQEYVFSKIVCDKKAVI